MKQMIQKFIEHLYWKYCNPNIVSMTREQLGIFNKAVAFKDLSKEEQKNLRVQAKTYRQDKHFQNIIITVIREILFDSKVGNPDSKKIKSREAIEMDRYTINGICLLWEKIEELSIVSEKKQVKWEDEDDRYSVV